MTPPRRYSGYPRMSGKTDPSYESNQPFPPSRAAHSNRSAAKDAYPRWQNAPNRSHSHQNRSREPRSGAVGRYEPWRNTSGSYLEAKGPSSARYRSPSRFMERKEGPRRENCGEKNQATRRKFEATSPREQSPKLAINEQQRLKRKSVDQSHGRRDQWEVRKRWKRYSTDCELDMDLQHPHGTWDAKRRQARYSQEALNTKSKEDNRDKSDKLVPPNAEMANFTQHRPLNKMVGSVERFRAQNSGCFDAIPRQQRCAIESVYKKESLKRKNFDLSACEEDQWEVRKKRNRYSNDYQRAPDLHNQHRTHKTEDMQVRHSQDADDVKSEQEAKQKNDFKAPRQRALPTCDLKGNMAHGSGDQRNKAQMHVEPARCLTRCGSVPGSTASDMLDRSSEKDEVLKIIRSNEKGKCGNIANSSENDNRTGSIKSPVKNKATINSGTGEKCSAGGGVRAVGKDNVGQGFGAADEVKHEGGVNGMFKPHASKERVSVSKLLEQLNSNSRVITFLYNAEKNWYRTFPFDKPFPSRAILLAAYRGRKCGGQHSRSSTSEQAVGLIEKAKAISWLLACGIKWKVLFGNEREFPARCVLQGAFGCAPQLLVPMGSEGDCDAKQAVQECELDDCKWLMKASAALVELLTKS